MTDETPGDEPFAYMSSSNYRGLRSPWSILALAAIMLVTGISSWSPRSWRRAPTYG